MRLKRSNSGVRVCVLVSFVVLVALALTATSALALTNPERHYEMVSPPFKDGYAAQPIEAVAQNGESVAYFSPGTFAGRPVGLSEGLNPMPYVARRGASGWSTTPISPPPGVTPDIQGTETQDVSPTLEATTVLGKLGPNYEVTTQNGVQGQAFIHSVGAPDTAANWEAAGPVLEALQKTTIDPAYRGTSANLCHFIIEAGTTDQAPLREQLLPEPLGEFSSHLYEVGRGGGDCGGEPPSLRFVGVNNAGKLISPSCAEGLGSRAEGSPSVISPPSHSSFNAVPAGGREVFFEASTDGCEQLNVYQLFVRVGGVKTIEVSRPLSSTCVEVPCGGAAVAAARASAEFVGASRDGSRVFFTTKAPLVEEDKDEGNDLYMASIGCPAGVGEACEPAEAQNTKVTSLVQVSHDPHGGEAAEVQGVVQLAPDGSHVYFVARGLLGEGSNKQGQSPTKGADNLYVYDSATGRVAFIADLCSGPSDSGVMEDAHCPANLFGINDGINDIDLWEGGGFGERQQAQTAGADGGFLVFSSYGQLVAGDTDTTPDVYRYDAETGALERVSVGEGGYDSNGNSDAFGVKIINHNLWSGTVQAQYEMDSRVVSEDGSRIVFTTAEPLSPGATNGLENVYEWHQEPGASEGRVSLISGGSGTQSVEDVVISPDGRNVFFVTSQGLVSQDTDGAPDVYDARLGEGFPVEAAPPQECSGDACQGALTNPAPLLVPGSVSQAPGGNFAASVPAKVVKSKAKAKPVKCKRGYVKKKGKCVRKPRAKKAGKKRRVKS